MKFIWLALVSLKKLMVQVAPYALNNEKQSTRNSVVMDSSQSNNALSKSNKKVDSSLERSTMKSKYGKMFGPSLLLSCSKQSSPLLSLMLGDG